MAATPGWYPDPNNAAVERYWNGGCYTGQRAAKPADAWPAGWYAVVGDPTIQREWDGTQWTGITRPTKRVLGVVVGGNPKKVDEAAGQFAGAIQRLRAAQAAGRRGGGRIEWVAAYAAVREAHGPDSQSVWTRTLNSIGFSPAFVRSPTIGSIPALTGGVVEVYEDFVIFGTRALDTTRNSSLSVLQEGQKQVTVTNIVDKKGRVSPIQQVHDLRTASILASGPYGSLRADIHPDHAPHAQQIAAQFNARVRALSPSAVTASDLKAMVDAILSMTGQPAAEKLRELDRLRYDRLLSDEDWKRAKARILANV